MKLYSGYIVVVVYVHLMEFGMWEVVFYYMCGYVEEWVIMESELKMAGICVFVCVHAPVCLS